MTKKEIMVRAWEIRKRHNHSMSAALKAAWSEAKGYSNISEFTKRIEVKENETTYSIKITDFDFAFTLNKVKSFASRTYNPAQKTWEIPKNWEGRYDITTFMMNN